MTSHDGKTYIFLAKSRMQATHDMYTVVNKKDKVNVEVGNAETRYGCQIGQIQQ